jgi:CubicO group peptidase (beta-lactamase class C family)
MPRRQPLRRVRGQGRWRCTRDGLRRAVPKRRWTGVLATLVVLLLFPTVAGCGGPSPEELATISYVPLERADWQTATPEEVGLDPLLVARAYYEAQKRDTLFGLLVVRDGKLVAEHYYNGADVDEIDRRASVTKSYTSALAGIAIDQGFLPGVDAKMLDYFPDVAPRITDPRKWDITIRDMLEMEAGYPWEEDNDLAWNILWTGDYLHAIEDLPLTADPGTKFQYSTLTAHWTGVVVARSTGLDLMSLGNEYLFGPLGVTPGENWNRDVDGYYMGGGDILFTARDMARFGQLYLDGGVYNGQQVISTSWVNDSIATRVKKSWSNIGKFKDMGYGYYWWTATCGDHQVSFAWGHGGNLIVLVPDQNTVVVVTADSFYGPDNFTDSWPHEKANIELAANFIASLPAE